MLVLYRTAGLSLVNLFATLQQLEYIGPTIGKRLDWAIVKNGGNGIPPDPPQAPTSVDAAAKAGASSGTSLSQHIRTALEARAPSLYKPGNGNNGRQGAAAGYVSDPPQAQSPPPAGVTKTARPYVPRYKSGAYAILVTLYHAEQVCVRVLSWVG